MLKTEILQVTFVKALNRSETKIGNFVDFELQSYVLQSFKVGKQLKI